MWAGFPGRYILQRWNVTTGSKEVEWSRRVDWFPESAEPGTAYSPERPPQTVLLDLREASPTRLWTLTAVADANWKKHLRRRVGPEGPFYGVTSYTGFYDTMVELIDTLTGRVVATRRVDAFLRGFVDDNHVFSIEIDSDGVAQNDIWAITIALP
jgi:hypothetical protein